MLLLKTKSRLVLPSIDEIRTDKTEILMSLMGNHIFNYIYLLSS